MINNLTFALYFVEKIGGGWKRGQNKKRGRYYQEWGSNPRVQSHIGT